MMTATRYAARELQRMTLAQLQEHGGELGLAFNKNHSRRERIKRIIAAYTEGDIDVPPSSHTTTGDQTPGPLPQPEFERLIDAPADLPLEHQRGGERPGAGRPPGMTEEIATYNRLSQQPHPAIKMGVEKVFELWSRRTKCPAVRLSKEEAVALALPWTHAYELSPLHDKIPPWLMVVLSCLWTTAVIFDSKAAVAREWRDRQPGSPIAPAPVESLN